jgi:hypothetical protein
VGNHSLDRAFDDQLGMATAATLGRLGVMPADETGVAHVLLLDFFLAGKYGLLGIDHYNVIAGIDVAGKNGLVFAAKQDGGFFRHTTDNLVVCIDNVPLAFDLLGFCTKSFHREPKIKPCRTRCVKDFRGYFWETKYLDGNFLVFHREGAQGVLSKT